MVAGRGTRGVSTARKVSITQGVIGACPALGMSVSRAADSKPPLHGAQPGEAAPRRLRAPPAYTEALLGSSAWMVIQSSASAGSQPSGGRMRPTDGTAGGGLGHAPSLSSCHHPCWSPTVLPLPGAQPLVSTPPGHTPASRQTQVSALLGWDVLWAENGGAW